MLSLKLCMAPWLLGRSPKARLFHKCNWRNFGYRLLILAKSIAYQNADDANTDVG